MDFTPDIALGLFISGSLLTLATMLIVAGRRRSESLILAFFLVLVALNFGAIAAAHLWTSAAWGRVAYIALAMDPLFLLLFVTSFPYERRSKGVWAFLALVSLSTLGLVIALLARPDLTPFAVRGPYMGVPPLYRAVAAQLHVAYLAAWIFSLKALKDAPTSRLQQRASWALVAVGIAVIPRFGPLLEEVGIYAAGVPPLWKVVLGEPTSVGSSLGATAIDHSFKGLLCASFLAGGWLHVRKLQAVRRPIAIVAAALMIVVLSQFLVTATYAIGIFGGTGVGTFGLRWPIFAVALAYGLLRDEVVEFSRWADIVFAVAGAIIAGLGAALATAVTLGRAQAPPYAIATLALAVGLAFLAPAA